MKILAITSEYPSRSINGSAAGLDGLICKLVDKGSEVTVLTGSSHNPDDIVQVLDDLRLSENAQAHRWARDRTNRSELNRAIQATHPDIILASDLSQGLDSLIDVLNAHDIPVLFDIGGRWALDVLQSQQQSSGKTLLKGEGTKFSEILRKGWFRSQYLRNEALRMGLSGTSVENLRIIHPSVIPMQPKLRYSSIRRLIWAGRMEEEQDPETPLHALCALHKEGHRNMTLDLWGTVTPEMSAHLLQLAKRLDIADAVTFCGSNRDAMRTELASYDVFIHTARCGLGFARNVAEAGVAGVPVIATMDGSVSEWLEDGTTGYAIAPGDVSGLVFQLKRLLESNDHGEAIAAAARRDAWERFSPENEWEAIDAEIEEVLKSLSKAA